MLPRRYRRTRVEETCDLLTNRFASITFIGDSVNQGMFRSLVSLANTGGVSGPCWDHSHVVPLAATMYYECRRPTTLTGDGRR